MSPNSRNPTLKIRRQKDVSVAIARGETSTKRLMDQFGLTYREVQKIKEDMR